jgi:hypothetical protein
MLGYMQGVLQKAAGRLLRLMYCIVFYKLQNKKVQMKIINFFVGPNKFELVARL